LRSPTSSATGSKFKIARFFALPIRQILDRVYPNDPSAIALNDCSATVGSRWCSAARDPLLPLDSGGSGR
jgi:hypothetical protein